MATAKKVVLEFDKEKETKNKQRYAETSDDPAVGILYVTKTAAKKLGDPEKITVTIEVAS